jgi:hypothetical protein
VPAVLAELLQESRPATSRFVDEWLAGADGRTSERIADLALRMMAEASPAGR